MDGAGSQEVCGDLSAFKAHGPLALQYLVPERLPMKRHPHRGIIVAGHPTSLRLEAEFWDFLREIAYERQLSLSELINAISQAKSRKVTLASALRVFVAQHYRAAAS
jgi:predicted DNA-binding ribbon-helix-helix protein